MRRFSFTTLAMIMMAVFANPSSDPQKYAADFSAPAAAAMLSGVADSPASSNS